MGQEAASEIFSLLNDAEARYLCGEYDQANILCRKALAIKANSLEAHFMLATVCYAQQVWSDAVTYYQQACEIAPQLGFLRINMALALQESGRIDEALSCYKEAFLLDGPSVKLYYNRGVLLMCLERLDEARKEFEQALAIDPNHVNAWQNLSAVCLKTDDTDGAIHSCRHGLHIDANHISLVANLAAAYSKAFRFEESIAWHQRLLELVKPREKAEILGRIANCMAKLGLAEDSIDCFQQAVDSSDNMAQKRALASSRLFILHYSALWSSQSRAYEHLAWGRNYFPSARHKSFANSREPERPLRVAYLSPDLKIHAVVFFLQPVLAAHDPSQVIIYCYSDVKTPDAVTNQLKEKHAVIWRDCARLPDNALQQQLIEDQIDILVDLAGHTAGNRLTLFADRAAPIQISWIGYPNTTGVVEMDYRITDSHADPPGITESFHTEKLVRLPDSFLCYRPGADFPDVGTLPCTKNGYITFGSLNNFMKITPGVLDLWARILVAVPKSLLVFRARGVTMERFQQVIAPTFNRYGVETERITILGHVPSVVENLKDYHRMDIALDTFPYNGTTTTCESLCMGVPVVTMAGDSHLSRVGNSLLRTVGLQELIADSEEQYCSLACRLASDVEGLVRFRATLRDRLLASPLADNIRFTGYLEQAYRKMWRDWCNNTAV